MDNMINLFFVYSLVSTHKIKSENVDDKKRTTMTTNTERTDQPSPSHKRETSQTAFNQTLIEKDRNRPSKGAGEHAWLQEY